LAPNGYNLYNMSGNVQELSCETFDAWCWVVGGSYNNDANEIKCISYNITGRDATYDIYTGFRCVIERR
jgi:formylglycine-generating enzyme required for sulfatase activity